ncbi:MAG: peptide chain release factor N(5)-glutamine methyltransferase [Ignavibacteriaceae bacterium]
MDTILELITKTTEYFEKKGIESPRLNAELLLADILGCKRLDLYMRFESTLSGEELDKYRDHVRRRGKLEPLQYITGYTEFYGLRINVNGNVLIPRPETELLVEEVIKEAGGREGLRILDICTGSGNIPIALKANLPGADVTGIEISAKAIETAKENAGLHGFNGGIKFIEADIRESGLRIEGEYEIITANPPYVTESEWKELERGISEWEPKEALTDGGDGISYYPLILEIGERNLRSGGRIYMEIGTGQAGEIEKKMAEKKYTNIRTISDYREIPRIITGEKE